MPVISSRGNVQLAVQHSGKSKCSHCAAQLHVFACNLTPLCNIFLGRFVHQRSKILGMLCLSRELAGCFAAVTNFFYLKMRGSLFIVVNESAAMFYLYGKWCIPAVVQ